jgi:hypothetical protein
MNVSLEGGMSETRLTLQPVRRRGKEEGVRSEKGAGRMPFRIIRWYSSTVKRRTGKGGIVPKLIGGATMADTVSSPPSIAQLLPIRFLAEAD